MEEWGSLRGCRYLLHDRDAKFCPSFRELIKTGSVNLLRLPARSPNLNSYAERWVKSVKEECLSRLILFGESSLRRALQQYLGHYHGERNHQGKGNRIFVSFAPRGKGEHGSSAVSRTTGRPAEVLREGSGIKWTGQRAMGSRSTHIKDAGNLFWQKTSRA